MAWLLSALARDDQGYVLYNVGSSVFAMVLMLPATFMAGMTLPLITYLLLRGPLGERSIGFVYSANTLGSIGGVVLAVHIGLPLLGLKGSLVAAAAIDVALGALLIWGPARRRLRLGYSVAVVVGVIGVAMGTHSFAIDPLQDGVRRVSNGSGHGSGWQDLVSPGWQVLHGGCVRNRRRQGRHFHERQARRLDPESLRHQAGLARRIHDGAARVRLPLAYRPTAKRRR